MFSTLHRNCKKCSNADIKCSLTPSALNTDSKWLTWLSSSSGLGASVGRCGRGTWSGSASWSDLLSGSCWADPVFQHVLHMTMLPSYILSLLLQNLWLNISVLLVLGWRVINLSAYVFIPVGFLTFLQLVCNFHVTSDRSQNRFEDEFIYGAVFLWNPSP